MEVDQQFLEYVLKALVDYPDEIKILRQNDDLGVLLHVQCHKNDMGKIIGRKGATSSALRTLVRVVGMRNGARVNLKIDEPVDVDSELGRERARGAFAGVVEPEKVLS